ncbi:hypothetical protein A3Q56_04048, partial [Intoshia linei]
NESTLKLIENLTKLNDCNELEQIFLQKLKFGTAGIRAPMGPGFGCLNYQTIIAISRAFAFYLNTTQTPNILIGYDTRHNSKRFAEICGLIMHSMNVKTNLLEKYVPTPLISFGVPHFGYHWGIMITASHNPPIDNGFKIYSKNGQPILNHIETIIENNINFDFDKPYIDKIIKNSADIFQLIHQQDDENLIINLKEIKLAYYNEIGLFYNKLIQIDKNQTKVVYSAFHGVGKIYVEESFKYCDIDALVFTSSQCEPDPNFSTLKFPNPELGLKVYAESIAEADKHNLNVIFATDPDADRFCMCERKQNGGWHCFTGDEIAALFCWWLWKSQKEMMKKKCYEESIGYICGPDFYTYDKDGITAAVVAYKMIHFILNTKNINILDQLQSLYVKYGYHISENSFIAINNGEEIFNKIRNFTKIKGSNQCNKFKDYKISNFVDLTFGIDTSKKDNKSTYPKIKGNFLILNFDNNVTIRIRASGTEPKVKYYAEMVYQNVNQE